MGNPLEQTSNMVSKPGFGTAEVERTISSEVEHNGCPTG